MTNVFTDLVSLYFQHPYNVMLEEAICILSPVFCAADSLHAIARLSAKMMPPPLCLLVTHLPIPL